MSDPASYIATSAGTGRRITLTLRGPLHEYPTSFELSRDEALKLLTGLSKALFATASHDPRPADPSPVTDNDEIDAIVGALAALTDRVRALESELAILRAQVGDGDVSTVAEELEALRRELPAAIVSSLRSLKPRDKT